MPVAPREQSEEAPYEGNSRHRRRWFRAYRRQQPARRKLPSGLTEERAGSEERAESTRREKEAARG